MTRNLKQYSSLGVIDNKTAATSSIGGGSFLKGGGQSGFMMQTPELDGNLSQHSKIVGSVD
jgi:hypothetical protein